MDRKKNQIPSTAFRRTDAIKKTGFYGKVCIKACLEIEKTGVLFFYAYRSIMKLRGVIVTFPGWIESAPPHVFNGPKSPFHIFFVNGNLETGSVTIKVSVNKCF